MTLRKEYIIEGKNFSSEATFYDEIQRVLIPDLDFFGRNLSAFNDILRYDFRPHETGSILRWRDHEKSKKDLSERLSDGQTLFETLIEIIRIHGPGGCESEDDIILILE